MKTQHSRQSIPHIEGHLEAPVDLGFGSSGPGSNPEKPAKSGRFRRTAKNFTKLRLQAGLVAVKHLENFVTQTIPALIIPLEFPRK
jgi:hypothetical protein